MQTARSTCSSSPCSVHAETGSAESASRNTNPGENYSLDLCLGSLLISYNSYRAFSSHMMSLINKRADGPGVQLPVGGVQRSYGEAV